MRVNGKFVHKLWQRRTDAGTEVRLLGRGSSGATYALAVVKQAGKRDKAKLRAAVEQALDATEAPGGPSI